MKTNKYWIAEIDPENFRVFTKGKNVMRFVEILNFLSEGKTLSDVWNPVFLQLYQGDEQEGGDVEREKSKPIPDFTRGMLGISINPKAHSILEPVIADQVSFLPLDTEVGPYYELDTQKINCVDLEKSHCKYFSSGKVMRVEKYALLLEKIGNMHIFKPLDIMLKPVFVSDTFKKVVEKSNLTGLIFHPIPLVEEG
jgi:hypothetical protein